MDSRHTGNPYSVILEDHYRSNWAHMNGAKKRISETMLQLIVDEIDPRFWKSAYFGRLNFPENPDDRTEIMVCADKNVAVIDRWFDPEKTNHLPFNVGPFLARALEGEYREKGLPLIAERCFPTEKGVLRDHCLIKQAGEISHHFGDAIKKLLEIAPNGLEDDSTQDIAETIAKMQQVIDLANGIVEQGQGELAVRNKLEVA